MRGREVIQVGAKKLIAIVLLVAGIVVLVLSLAADAMGFGGNPGFGSYQIVGAIVGAVAAILGLVLMRRK